MPRTPDTHLAAQVSVTPRFEIFYALQALESGVGHELDGWRRDTERRIPARIRTSIASVGPSPLIWPLLADALRDEPPTVTFPEMLEALRQMDDSAFQRSVLGGVFKSAGTVDGLMSGRTTLRDAVSAESRGQSKLLSLIGLLPFIRKNATARTFERIVSAPGEYRSEVVTVLESFWSSAFADTWARLEPQMKESARAMKQQIARTGLGELAREWQLPLIVDEETVSSRSGSTRVRVDSVLGVHLIPSAFNVSRLWAAYIDSHKRTRFYLPVLDPVLDPELLPDAAASADPSLVFKALGDTTRYAMVGTIARTPMTSVELARAFGVSKPTISHHVQQLRAAGLVDEAPVENGVVLSLNRRTLEGASAAAVREMFSGRSAERVIKRTRKANKPR
ncbi:MAG: DUF5937 family protein [Gemmatimonadales bacterium]